MLRIGRGRSRRQWPPFGFWLLASVVVLAIMQRRQGDGAIDGDGPEAETVIEEGPGPRLAARLADLELTEPVTDEELAKAWRALRDRARSGKAGEVAALFAVAERQRLGE